MNYFEVRTFSLKYRRYVYIDTLDYKADSVIMNSNIRMKIIKEFIKEEDEYVLIYCKVRKDDAIRFENAMERVKNKILLCGHSDYEKYCDKVLDKLFGKE